jgi:hypothetical protein
MYATQACQCAILHHQLRTAMCKSRPRDYQCLAGDGGTQARVFGKLIGQLSSQGVAVFLEKGVSGIVP